MDGISFAKQFEERTALLLRFSNASSKWYPHQVDNPTMTVEDLKALLDEEEDETEVFIVNGDGFDERYSPVGPRTFSRIHYDNTGRIELE